MFCYNKFEFTLHYLLVLVFSFFKMNGKAGTSLYGHEFMIEIKNKPTLKHRKVRNWQCIIKHINSGMEIENDSFKSPKECAVYSMKTMLIKLAKNKSLFTWEFIKALLSELRKQENGNWTKSKMMREVSHQLMVNNPYQTLLLFMFIIFVILFTILLYPYHKLNFDLTEYVTFA